MATATREKKTEEFIELLLTPQEAATLVRLANRTSGHPEKSRHKHMQAIGTELFHAGVRDPGQHLLTKDSKIHFVEEKDLD